MNAVSVGVGPLSIDDVVNVARFDAPVELTDEALATIADTRHRIEELANDPTPVYGISTGFGGAHSGGAGAAAFDYLSSADSDA